MITVTVTLKSTSNYSQSKAIFGIDKKDKESPSDFEARTWRERCHYDASGKMYIPPMQFKKTLDEAAAFLSEKIPGKGNHTYVKHFLAGTSVMDYLPLPITKDEVAGEWLFVPSDGKRGGTTRVHKCFPLITEWGGDVVYYIHDNTITEDIFTRYLKEAGKFIGIGRFRPRNGGFYGRFTVENVVWENDED